MAKNIEETKEGLVTRDEKGYYVTPFLQRIVDEDGNTEEVQFKIQIMQNRQMYNQALLKFSTSKDLNDLSSVVLPKMIVEPRNAGKMNFYDNSITVSPAILPSPMFFYIVPAAINASITLAVLTMICNTQAISVLRRIQIT